MDIFKFISDLAKDNPLSIILIIVLVIVVIVYRIEMGKIKQSGLHAEQELNTAKEQWKVTLTIVESYTKQVTEIAGGLKSIDQTLLNITQILKSQIEENKKITENAIEFIETSRITMASVKSSMDNLNQEVREKHEKLNIQLTSMTNRIGVIAGQNNNLLGQIVQGNADYHEELTKVATNAHAQTVNQLKLEMVGINQKIDNLRDSIQALDNDIKKPVVITIPEPVMPSVVAIPKLEGVVMPAPG